MKRRFAVLLAVCLLFTASGCGKQTDAARLSVVCTAFPQYDFLRELTAGVEGIHLTLLLKPGQESHDYDPSSQDILAIHNCDMFVYVGGQSEHWITQVLKTVDTSDKTLLALLDMVSPEPELSDHDHTHDHDHAESYDEHVWTAPPNAIAIVRELAQQLIALDPVAADSYRQNAARYETQLAALDAKFQETVANGNRRTIVVADRFPLLYFCHAYHLDHLAAFAGCAASVEPSSEMVRLLIDTVTAQQIPVIFQMELSAGGVAQTVAEATGCRVATFYACHNLSKTDFEAGEGYLSLMQKNADALKEALQ